MADKYKNPIIFSDFSDPDAIRVGDDFYMVSSSFNYFPSVPILHSKNLVEWEVVNFVFDDIDLEVFNSVRHGEGAWAPSIREYDGWFYCLIPFPDQGVYMCKTQDILGKWSKPLLLIDGKGIIDPCPIWDNGKAYVVCAFVKSRIGFNSELAVFEVSQDLSQNLSKTYTVVYDGHNDNPTIEGPKFYKRNEYFYILAPAGGVKSGWQVALRSKNIYGPYESKIVLMQGDSDVNGPHQGALIDLYGDFNYFLHFQDKNEYGRIIHLQPVTWIDDWCVIGCVKDKRLAGTPTQYGDYPVAIKTDYKIKSTFDFTKKEVFSLQTPSRRNYEFCFDKGLKLFCKKFSGNLIDYPYSLTQKILYEKFVVSARCSLQIMTFGDRIGLGILGKSYAFVLCKKVENKYFADFIENEKTLFSKEIDDSLVTFQIKTKVTNGRLFYQLGVDGYFYKKWFVAEKGRWIGSRIAILSLSNDDSCGYGEFFDFNQIEIK